MNRIAELRKKNGISQAQLGKVLGVAQNTISNWENGNREPDNESLRKMSALFDVSINYILGADEQSVSSASGVWIPVLGTVAAGIPLEAIENVVGREEITAEMARAGKHVALRIHGDSMEPKFSDGDVVIVRLQPEVENGEIAIVFVNGDEATCKKIKKTPEGVMLISLNPAYEPMFYSAREVEELPVRIFGKVVELRAKF